MSRCPVGILESVSRSRVLIVVAEDLSRDKLVKADRPAEGLIAFAEREGITHVIFGESARSRWEVLWRGSTIEKFLGRIRDAAVQVVPLDDRSV